MHDQQLSTELSSNGSLGLADLIVQQLSPDGKNFMPGSVLRTTNDIFSDKSVGSALPHEQAEKAEPIVNNDKASTEKPTATTPALRNRRRVCEFSVGACKNSS